ncbi:cyclic nucleotide-binding domain-containing protein 1 [Sorex fumeus]|uniref:cyclic nucleotide-binding domain-containing protein 1 n=1 Tax=Sorex fumeus TaxID=62283 RepID=UPI0024ACCE07|nr:cyclic nucleotide-binding domain-containing protein 1 [Sorex fumeus]
MPMSSLPTAILSHMKIITNVPPPSLRSIPRLKASKIIDYGQLNELCHMRGLEYKSFHIILSAHEEFISQYPKIFVKKETKLKPKERKTQPPESEETHNIAVYLKKVHGNRNLYRQEAFEESIRKLLTILKKSPTQRTKQEHNIVWKMLKTIPDLTEKINSEQLKSLSMNIFSETWIKGSTVFGNDGFYVILKGLARLQKDPYKHLVEDIKSATSLMSSNCYSFVYNQDFKNTSITDLCVSSKCLKLKQWSTFGTLEITPGIQSDKIAYAVVTEEDCEIIKIPAKQYENLKLEMMKHDIAKKENLISKCPCYVELPTVSISKLATFIKWKKFSPGHVIAESGSIITFVAFINSGYCEIYRNIIAFVNLHTKMKKVRKLVYMGTLNEKESFGEISVLLQVPFACTLIAGSEVELAIIEDKNIFALDTFTQQYMLKNTRPTSGHLTDEDVRNEYVEKEKKREWETFKRNTMKEIFRSNGIIPDFGKWTHNWASIPRNLKTSLIN